MTFDLWLRGENIMEMKLEVVPLPVSDIDRARDFYVQKIGFHLDHDSEPMENVRVVQLTPPGSGCSIVIGAGLGEISEMIPGSVKGLHLVVKDVQELREILLSRGVAVGDIIEYPRGIKYAHFKDPDGNSWALQEIPPGL
jgi:catechol 2,3-dioxygenase-like lactoylglutathione lyase family enzyme